MAILADLGCMLWSNLTKLNSVCSTCLKLPLSLGVGENILATDLQLRKKIESSSTPLIDLSIELFARGENKKINKHANYDFLASVWANFSSVRNRVFFLPFFYNVFERNKQKKTSNVDWVWVFFECFCSSLMEDLTFWVSGLTTSHLQIHPWHKSHLSLNIPVSFEEGAR